MIVHQLQHVGLERALAGGLDDDLGAPPVGQQPDAVVVALVKAELVEQRVGLVGIELAPGVGIFRLEERAFGQDRVGAFLPRPKKTTLLISCRSIASDSARRKRTSRKSSRQTVVGAVEVRQQRDARAARPASRD